MVLHIVKTAVFTMCKTILFGRGWLSLKRQRQDQCKDNSQNLEIASITQQVFKFVPNKPSQEEIKCQGNTKSQSQFNTRVYTRCTFIISFYQRLKSGSHVRYWKTVEFTIGHWPLPRRGVA